MKCEREEETMHLIKLNKEKGGWRVIEGILGN